MANIIYDYVLSWYRYLLTLFSATSELRVTVVGLQNSGKTTFVRLLGGEHFTLDTVPTVGMSYKRFRLQNIIVKCYDLGGQVRFEPLWRDYYTGNDNLICFVIDISDTTRLIEARRQLLEIIEHSKQHRNPLLIIGNKKDLADKTLTMVEFFANSLGIDLHQQTNEIFIRKELPVVIPPKRTFINGNDFRKNSLLKLDLSSTVNYASTDNEENEDNLILLERDVGLFLTSFKTGDGLVDILQWIIGRDI